MAEPSRLEGAGGGGGATALLNRVEGGRPDAPVRQGRRHDPAARDWLKNSNSNLPRTRTATNSNRHQKREHKKNVATRATFLFLLTTPKRRGTARSGLDAFVQFLHRIHLEAVALAHVLHAL